MQDINRHAGTRQASIDHTGARRIWIHRPSLRTGLAIGG